MRAKTIMYGTCKALNVPYNDLVGHTRSQYLVDARYICYLQLLQRGKNIKRIRIARIFKRHHTSVLHGVAQANTWLENNIDFKLKYELVESFFNNQNKQDGTTTHTL